MSVQDGGPLALTTLFSHYFLCKSILMAKRDLSDDDSDLSEEFKKRMRLTEPPPDDKDIDAAHDMDAGEPAAAAAAEEVAAEEAAEEVADAEEELDPDEGWWVDYLDQGEWVDYDQGQWVDYAALHEWGDHWDRWEGWW